MTRDHILSEIRRTARENNGVALGKQRFETETGIKIHDWLGRFWARWGDALKEAGFEPNQITTARSVDDMLSRVAALAKELGHFPTDPEMRVKVRSDPEFPSHSTVRNNIGGIGVLIARVREFCVAHDQQDVAALCVDRGKASSKAKGEPQPTTDVEIGFVYLLKSGRFYKIGRSNAVGRRERELAIQLPERSKIVHTIKTDDPAGIEAYWHGRFADRRQNGEWFDLRAGDVSAFRRRKFM